MRKLSIVIALSATLMALSAAATASTWVTSATGTNLGADPYDDPNAVIGKPTLEVYEKGGWPVPAGTFKCSMVYPAWNTAPDGSKIITMILQGGEIVADFGTPVYDDPQNWYGKDFIIFGNSKFDGYGYVYQNTNMEEYNLQSGTAGNWEPMTVSVSQDGITWYEYIDGPYADDFAPTQSYAWDWIENTWGPEMDFTKPIDPSLTKSSFGSKTAATAINMYADSAGGTAFDLSQLPLPTDPVTGQKWIRFVKVTANLIDKWGIAISGEIDAFARVGHAASSISIGKAKQLSDGARVILEEAVVSASTYTVGRCCYVEHENYNGGIRVLGRVLNAGQKVKLYGVMDTVAGERVLRCTAVESLPDTGEVKPLGLANKSLGESGLNPTGLLVRTWGKVISRDTTDRTFVVDDGSGTQVKCAGPRLQPGEFDSPNPTNPDWGVAPDTSFVLPSVDSFVTVTGISSSETDAQGNFQPVLRLRSQDDLN